MTEYNTHLYFQVPKADLNKTKVYAEGNNYNCTYDQLLNEEEEEFVIAFMRQRDETLQSLIVTDERILMVQPTQGGMEIDFISINAMNISLIAVCERSPAEKNLHSHLRIVTDTNRSFVFDLHIRAALLQKILSRYI